MIDADALFEAEQQALGQLAQMDLALAARIHAQAMDAEDPKALIELTRSYQRASRCVRQTILLRARLRHDRDRHLLATRPPGRAPFKPLFDDDLDDECQVDPDELRIDGRTMDLQEAAERVTAAARPDLTRREREEQLDRIDAWIDQEIDEHEDFGEQPLDDHVLEMCRAFDLPEALARRFRVLPRAPRDPDALPTDGYNFEGWRETG